MSDSVIYAIGDVHGEATRYGDLLAAIFEHHELMYADAPMKIIQVGDLVDRGPDSFGVVQTAIDLEKKQPKGSVIHLLGNHERMLLDVMDDEGGSNYSFWLSNGGVETLSSYRLAGYETVSKAHINWLKKRPILYADDATKLIFVHAGIDVTAYPDCREDVRLWTRSPKFFQSDKWTNEALSGWRVVHGHTPTDDYLPDVDGAGGRRINIDTGAVFGGSLTAAVFAPGDAVRFLHA